MCFSNKVIVKSTSSNKFPTYTTQPIIEMIPYNLKQQPSEKTLQDNLWDILQIQKVV